MNCSTCLERGNCKKLCEKADKYANQDYVPMREEPSHIRLLEYSTADYKGVIDENREHNEHVLITVAEKIKDMPNGERKAVTALKFFGFTYRDISGMLSVPIITVYRKHNSTGK